MSKKFKPQSKSRKLIHKMGQRFFYFFFFTCVYNFVPRLKLDRAFPLCWYRSSKGHAFCLRTDRIKKYKIQCNIYVLCITDLSVSGPKLTLVDEIIIIGIAGEIVY